MAVATHTLISLKKRLWQSLGDYLTFDTTTDITTDTEVISTTLRNYDGATDGYFDDWWVYISGVENGDVSRKTGATTYATATGTLTCYGANFSAETAAVTCYMSRYDPDGIERAIIDACEEIYPTLHLPLDDMTLVTGNILPDFDDWASSTAMTHYSTTNANLVRTSSTTEYGRYGTYSAKVTASAAAGYLYISSDTYPRLLDLQDQSVDAYVLAYPEVADDPTIEIYTIDYAGSTQTLTSTTSATAGRFTILELKNQELNDDLEEIQIRMKVATDAKYTYFDSPVLFGRKTKEYMLPTKFRDGELGNIRMQSEGHQEPPCFDLHPFATIHSGKPLRFDTVDEGNWRYLRLLDPFLTQRRLRLTGYKPLETLSADTDTITLDAERVSLLMAEAEIIFLEREMQPVSSEDIPRYERALSRAYGKRQRLFYKHRMAKPTQYF